MTDRYSVYRDRANGRIAGVCAGLGDYFELRPGLIRTFFVLLAFVMTPVLAIMIYAILALILPARPWRSHTSHWNRSWRAY